MTANPLAQQVRQRQAKIAALAPSNGHKPPELPAQPMVENWKLQTLADAYQDLAPVKQIVEGVVFAASLAIWFGAPGSFKSWLLAYMAVCVAAGVPFLEPRPDRDGHGLATTQCPVLWLDFDNGKRRTHKRFAALGRGLALPPDIPLYYVSMPTPHLDAGDPIAMLGLSSLVRSKGIELVIIDNLGVISGDADENSADMQVPMGGLRWLTESTGAAIHLLHHPRKAGPYGTEKRLGDTLRGHSSVEAKLDLAMLLTRSDKIVTCRPTKERDAEVQPFSAEFSFQHDAGGELLTAGFWQAGAADTDRQARANLQGRILKVLQVAGEPMNKTAVATKIRARRQEINEALAAMQLAGIIIAQKGPKNSDVFSVPE